MSREQQFLMSFIASFLFRFFFQLEQNLVEEILHRYHPVIRLNCSHNIL